MQTGNFPTGQSDIAQLHCLQSPITPDFCQRLLLTAHGTTLSGFSAKDRKPTVLGVGHDHLFYKQDPPERKVLISSVVDALTYKDNIKYIKEI